MKIDRKHLFMTLKILIIGLLPLLLCALYCLAQGGSLFGVYLPSSKWNDELLYYKQVEGIISYAWPQGFFGYNESQARVLSFASWSPLLYLPWSLFGCLFGWNLMSPILANILFLSMALICFLLLVKPNWKQLLLLVLMLSTYRSLTRYLMSAVPEVICHSLVIVFCALSVSYQEKQSKGKLIAMFLISAYATLMRPYFILFFLLPAWYAWRRWKWKGAGISGLIVCVTAIAYAIIGKFFQAAYLAPLFSTEWIRAFFEKGIFYGIGNLFKTLALKTKEFFLLTVGFRYNGLAQCGAYLAYGIVTFIIFCQCISDLITIKSLKNTGEEEKRGEILKHLPLRVFMAFSMIAMFVALLLMYPYEQGSRHVLLFVTTGMCVISTFQREYGKKLALVLAFLCIFYLKPVDPYEYEVPFRDSESVEKLAYWKESFDQKISLKTNDAPSFENTVIWMFNDQVDGVTKAGDWHVLYALPKGMGISLVTMDYATSHFEDLKSQYLMMPKGGSLDQACEKAGFIVIGEYEDTIVYSRIRQ